MVLIGFCPDGQYDSWQLRLRLIDKPHFIMIIMFTLYHFYIVYIFYHDYLREHYLRECWSLKIWLNNGLYYCIATWSPTLSWSSCEHFIIFTLFTFLPWLPQRALPQGVLIIEDLVKYRGLLLHCDMVVHWNRFSVALLVMCVCPLVVSFETDSRARHISLPTLIVRREEDRR